MELIIDGKNIKTREDFHNEMQKTAFMDGQYGRNLDALYDILRSVKAKIILKNVSQLKENLGGYADMIIEVLKNAEEDNEYLNVSYERIEI